jgi:hypothetical protein
LYANIRLAWKRLTVTQNYYNTELITIAKSFKVQVPEDFSTTKTRCKIVSGNDGELGTLGISFGAWTKFPEKGE